MGQIQHQSTKGMQYEAINSGTINLDLSKLSGYKISGHTPSIYGCFMTNVNLVSGLQKSYNNLQYFVVKHTFV